MHDDNIIALATPSGNGAIAIIRISGKNAISIVDPFFKSKYNKQLKNQKTHTIHLGNIIDNDRIIDEVLVSIFKNNQSYTGESTVEISCHGSKYIQQEIINLFLLNGCRMANAGEFTLRAFLNGKIDLSQAEAVADLIASTNESTHKIAMQQMRGGFSLELKELRQELLNFASLIELELDFSEEDVEFANREEFSKLINKIQLVLKRLIDSFAVGNVIKNGIPVAIVGEPNVGKSTLLNSLLNEERAIVSSIAGTTRDTIEDEMNINGISFRFIDTAGIRETKDEIESIGIKKTFEKINQAKIVVYLFDASTVNELNIKTIKLEIQKLKNKHPQKLILIAANKIDKSSKNKIKLITNHIDNTIQLSAKESKGVEILKQSLTSFIDLSIKNSDITIVTNSRHFDSLNKSLEEINKVKNGIESNLTSDLLAIDIRQALHHIGKITGNISSDDLLGNIFANFCIGK